MNIQQKIKVMQAYADGAAIECRHHDGGEWEDSESPKFMWGAYEYRVKVPDCIMVSGSTTARGAVESLWEAARTINRHIEWRKTRIEDELRTVYDFIEKLHREL